MGSRYMTPAAASVRFELVKVKACRSSCDRCIKIKSRISEGIVASVCLRLSRRFRGVPVDVNDLIDLMDIDDSEFRRLILF
jgi:hypothetical protein